MARDLDLLFPALVLPVRCSQFSSLSQSLIDVGWDLVAIARLRESRWTRDRDHGTAGSRRMERCGLEDVTVSAVEHERRNSDGTYTQIVSRDCHVGSSHSRAKLLGLV